MGNSLRGQRAKSEPKSLDVFKEGYHEIEKTKEI
jgi:hypothetical protein